MSSIVKKRKYVVECTAFKPSGKYYSGQRHDLFESESISFQEDIPAINKAVDLLKKDLDKACGLVPNSINANAFIVHISVLDIEDQYDQSCLQYLLLPKIIP